MIKHNPHYEVLDNHPLPREDTLLDKVRPNLDYEGFSQGYCLQLGDQIRLVDYQSWILSVQIEQDLTTEEFSQFDDEFSSMNAFIELRHLGAQFEIIDRITKLYKEGKIK